MARWETAKEMLKKAQSSASNEPVESPRPAQATAALNESGDAVCVNCGALTTMHVYGPPINDITICHIDSGVVWCNWPPKTQDTSAVSGDNNVSTESSSPEQESVAVYKTEPADRLGYLQSRIKAFGLLEKNWDSYGARTIYPEAIEEAFRLAPMFTDPKWFIAPRSDGDIQFESDDLEVHIEGFSDEAVGVKDALVSTESSSQPLHSVSTFEFPAGERLYSPRADVICELLRPAGVIVKESEHPAYIQPTEFSSLFSRLSPDWKRGIIKMMEIVVDLEKEKPDKAHENK